MPQPCLLPSYYPLAQALPSVTSMCPLCCSSLALASPRPALFPEGSSSLAAGNPSASFCPQQSSQDRSSRSDTGWRLPSVTPLDSKVIWPQARHCPLSFGSKAAEVSRILPTWAGVNGCYQPHVTREGSKPALSLAAQGHGVG